MSEKDIRNLILLGVGGFAIYMLFFRRSSAAALPFPATVTVTPRVTGPLPVGSMSPQGFPATPDESGSTGQNYDYVLVE